MGKQAIKDARKQILVAFKAYRLEVKKHNLFKKQTAIQDTLKQMGVVNRQIPVMVENSRAYKVKVRVA